MVEAVVAVAAEYNRNILANWHCIFKYSWSWIRRQHDSPYEKSEITNRCHKDKEESEKKSTELIKRVEAKSGYTFTFQISNLELL